MWGGAISMGVVAVAGGWSEAASEGPGKGSTFTIRLQTVQAEPALVGTPVHAGGWSWKVKGEAARVLLVEDHGDTAQVMKRLLTVAGFEVMAVADLATAMKAVREEHFDLVLSDLGLPDGSGVELVRWMRGHGLETPAIAISGYGQEQDVAECREAGFEMHLVKPVTVERLEEAIGKVMGARAGG